MSSIKKVLCLLFVIALAASLTGCVTMLTLMLKDYEQTITIEASDGGKYDFYVNEGIVCSYTDKCTFKHNLDHRCNLMVISARRDSTIYGSKEYGYGEVPFLISVLDKDGDEKYKKCPESLFGADVIVPINEYLSARDKRIQSPKNAARWDISPFASSSSNIRYSSSSRPKVQERTDDDYISTYKRFKAQQLGY